MINEIVRNEGIPIQRIRLRECLNTIEMVGLQHRKNPLTAIFPLFTLFIYQRSMKRLLYGNMPRLTIECEQQKHHPLNFGCHGKCTTL